ncbi:hypothetical protein CAPTEDRAFT_215897 [Capitella teleta]|uniref:Glycosyltransferase 61 catalytic domain-containing protein n=1 Tax=Capitella teleta TaxID=283909 RepID=R7TZH5_CAPTE|nr:hypothetical protein CAPTEDRAFT_215897 [Capitella teleta]|eukprot:ELT99174.1 hypothetical protein CAPTEDRAFT_215897 [Capitella teleta]
MHNRIRMLRKCAPSKKQWSEVTTRGQAERLTVKQGDWISPATAMFTSTLFAILLTFTATLLVCNYILMTSYFMTGNEAPNPVPARIFRSEEIPLTVEERIIKMDSHLKSYLNQIESIGKEVLKEETNNPTTFDLQSNTSQKLAAFNEDFFSDLKQFPFVQTVFFQLDFAEMRRLTFPKKYEFTSNNCEGLRKFNKYPINNCRSSHTALLEGYAVKEYVVNIGMPNNFIQEPHNETWTYLHIIQNAAVSEHGDVITRNLTLSPQRCRSDDGGKLPHRYGELKVYDHVLDVHQFWDHGFYHSTFESLPRLTPYVSFLNDNPDVMIYSRNNNDIQGLLGIQNLNKRLLKDNNFRAKVLYSPAGGRCGMPALLTTQLLSLYAKRDLENNPLTRDKIILIKRSYKRFFNNHDVIASMLAKEAAAHDLELVVFRDDPVPSVELTRRMFNEAILIVAPHGAGESNMMYAQPGTVLIEGVCYVGDRAIQLCYYPASQLLGIRYYALFFESGCSNITAEQIQTPVVHFLRDLHILRTTY